LAIGTTSTELEARPEIEQVTFVLFDARALSEFEAAFRDRAPCRRIANRPTLPILRLWQRIRQGTRQLSFGAYLEWPDVLSADEPAFQSSFAHLGGGGRTRVQYPDIDSYEDLKLAT
jgi:hypothetical protein